MEIIGTFRRAAVPSLKEPPAWYAQEAGSVRSLQDILNIVKRLQASCPREDGQTAAPAVAAASTAAPAAAEPAVVHGAATRQYRVSRARRCVCRVVEVPMDDAEPELPDGALLLIDDCRGLAAEVAAAAKLRGYATCVLAPEALASRESAATAIEQVRREYGPLAGVLHLAALAEAPCFPGIDEADWDRLVDREVKGLLYLLQALAPSCPIQRAACAWSPPVSAEAISAGPTKLSILGGAAWRES